jgi:hypothetical protein
VSGSTGRLNTIAQMEFLRDVGYPASLAAYKRALAIYAELARTDTSAARRYQNDVFGVANSQKAVTGYRVGLLDTLSMAKKRAFEQEFRARIAADPKLQAQYGTWMDCRAQRESRHQPGYGIVDSAVVHAAQLAPSLPRRLRAGNRIPRGLSNTARRTNNIKAP